jgi:hypothetical protein
MKFFKKLVFLVAQKPRMLQKLYLLSQDVALVLVLVLVGIRVSGAMPWS